MPVGGIQPSTSLLKSCMHIHLFKVLNNPASHCNWFCVDFYSIIGCTFPKREGRNRKQEGIEKEGRKEGKREKGKKEK